LLNKNKTNGATRFNSTNRRINNFLNKKTTSLILYKNESKVSRNIINKNNKSISTNVNNTTRTGTKNPKSLNNNITQHNSSTDDRINKIKFIQLFWKNNYFKRRVIPKVNLIIKHFRLYKKSKITLNQNKQNTKILSSHLKINHCCHGIKTFPRLKTDIGNLRYQIQSYMIHKEQAKIKSILNNREIQITKENNLLFTMDNNTEGIECDNIKDYNNKNQLIFNKEHPFIEHKQINSNTIFYPIKLVPLIPKNKTWQFQTKIIKRKENIIKKKFLHKDIIQNNCMIIYIICVIKSHIWNNVLFKIIDHIYASSSCNSKYNEVNCVLNKYLKGKNKIQEEYNNKNILCEQEL
jgi:hypothetical protein